MSGGISCAVMEMSNSREPDNAKSGSGWEERQSLVPNGSTRLPQEAPASLAHDSEDLNSNQANEPDLTPRSLTIPCRNSLGGAPTTSSMPRTPSRLFFGRCNSLQEGTEQPMSSRASLRQGIFSWKKGEYSALEDQVIAIPYNGWTARHSQEVLWQPHLQEGALIVFLQG